MSIGRVYTWVPSETEFTGGRVDAVEIPLLYLDPPREDGHGLSGRYAEVFNAARLVTASVDGGEFTSLPIGKAPADADGNYVFRPQCGGGPFEKRGPRRPVDPDKYVEASHFGEINAYHHLTLIAERTNRLLRRLGEKPVPKVRAYVNAHARATNRDHWRFAVADENGVKWRPVRGAHYRYPSEQSAQDATRDAAGLSGEIHLGPGVRSSRSGWLPRIAGSRYTCNTSHDAGEIYRALGFHITRHTADFQANALQSPYSQSNVKSQIDFAVSSYWAASQLGTPHYACWFKRNDPDLVDPSSLARDTFRHDLVDLADTHQKVPGQRFASALWELREALLPYGEDACDLLVLAALLEIGCLTNHPYRARIKETRTLRNGDGIFVAALLHADAARFDGTYGKVIADVMERWGLQADHAALRRFEKPVITALPATLAGSAEVCEQVELVRARDPQSIIPVDHEMITINDLDRRLRAIRHEPYDLVAAGDVMTGGRMRRPLRDHGPDYPFAWVKPLFRRASIVMANLEAPFARVAGRDVTTRRFSYRVNPSSAPSIRRAGINVMTVANNHLMDCGRDGVRETLATLNRQGIAAIGGGLDETTAHDPAVASAGALRIGLLGYYWNRRTAAGDGRPGSARDIPELVQRDIENLKPCVDRVVVTAHWGVPYERQPSDEDRGKARHFIDCGADMVIGHHPHIIQPMEIYRQRPIFYSVGNFAFGSGNSRAESILLAVGFNDTGIEVDVFPAYVRNRDPRLDYQPKLMCGDAARQTLDRLVSISGKDGRRLEIGEFYGRLRLNSVEGLSARENRAPSVMSA